LNAMSILRQESPAETMGIEESPEQDRWVKDNAVHFLLLLGVGGLGEQAENWSKRQVKIGVDSLFGQIRVMAANGGKELIEFGQPVGAGFNALHLNGAEVEFIADQSHSEHGLVSEVEGTTEFNGDGNLTVAEWVDQFGCRVKGRHIRSSSGQVIGDGLVR